MSHQSNLDSFFGSKPKGGGKQTKLTSFVAKKKNKTQSSIATDKENNGSTSAGEDKDAIVEDLKNDSSSSNKAKSQDGKDEEPTIAATKHKRTSPTSSTKQKSSENKRQKKKHPHAIVDDDESDDEEEKDASAKNDAPVPMQVEAKKEVPTENADSESNAGRTKASKKLKIKDDDDEDDDGVEISKTKVVPKNHLQPAPNKKNDKKVESKPQTIPKTKEPSKIIRNSKPSTSSSSSLKKISTETTKEDTPIDDDMEDGKEDGVAMDNSTPQQKALAQQAAKLAKALKLPSNQELLLQQAEIAVAAAAATTNSKIKKTKGTTSAAADTGLSASSIVGQPITYLTLCQTLEKIQAISGRLEIQALLTNLFRRVLLTNPKDIYPMVYLSSNSVAPAYKCVELGIGDAVLTKAIGEAYGTKPSVVKEKLNAEGDLGLVAQTCKSKQRTLGFAMSKPKPLLVSQVLNTLREIAQISGTKSQSLKVEKIKKLLVQVQDSTETKYIIRSLQGKLRIGLAESTVLVSLGHALSLTIPATVQPKIHDNTAEKKAKKDDNDEDVDEEDDEKETSSQDKSLSPEKQLEAAVNIIKQVYSEVPSYDSLLDAALTVPVTELPLVCRFEPGIPVNPMLAKPAKAIADVLKRLGGQPFTCEFKYDGERAQIHQDGQGQVKVFSRNLLETSDKYPEVPLFVQEAADAALLAQNEQRRSGKGDNGDDSTGSGDHDKAMETGRDAVTSFVLDAEVVAWNPRTKQLAPFQLLSTRKKTEESAETAKVQVIVQAFDLMYFNGESCLQMSLKQRRALMKRHFAPVEGKFQYATSLDFQAEDGQDTLNLEQFLDTAVKGQCEGLMVKTLDDVYEPSRRSLNWLKLKKDYLEGLGDSVDLVPLGAYKGRGKRTGVYGAYLLACFDADTEEFQSVCKIGTGFSDEDLQTLSATLNEHSVESKPSIYNVADGLECDVWFEPVQVWEVKAADLSQSSLHRGAMGKTGDPGRGIGLRFPRYERLRPDKKPEQATTSDQILEMYYNQDSINTNDKGDDSDEDGI